MSTTNEDKGARTSLRGLLDQAPVTIQLAKDQMWRLERYGLRAEMVADAETTLAELDTDRAKAIEARVASKDDRGDELYWLAAAKKHKRLLLSAADDLVRDGEITAAERAGLNAQGALGRSTPRHVEYLLNTQKVVERMASKLSALVGGADMATEHAFLLEGLREAQTRQESGRQALPEDTRGVNALKGRLLTFIERVNSAGKRAFDGDALMIARFNKDLLLRASATKKKKN